MGIERNGVVLRELRTLFSVGAVRDLTDGQLLERFATDRGEAAEQAFAALVERHGSMVLRVCRGVLVDPHDTQDAFQATFLVLVRRARTLWVRDSLGPWLHQVAFRTASDARKSAARRRRHERSAAKSAEETHPSVEDELGQVLHEEIERLPERFRAPVVLCDLEGRTHEQAARHLGWPIGTLKSRQSRGRERLRQRLIRRGLGPNAERIGPSVLVPPALVDSTTSTVVQFVMARAIVRGSAASLAQGVLRSMFITRWLKVASVLLIAGATASGVELLVEKVPAGVKAPAEDNLNTAQRDDRPVQEVKPGTIRFEVIERGSLESSHVHDAFSQVEVPTTIIFMVADGSQVKKGDLVSELDSAALKDTLVNQTITTHAAEAAYQNAKLAREVAELALVEYTEGILKQERSTLKTSIASAETAIQTANVRLERTRNVQKRVKEAMAMKGKAATPADMVAELDVEDRLEAAVQRLERERLALDQAKTKQDMLEKYTSRKTINGLKVEVEQKRADELAKMTAWRDDKSKEAKVRKQIENCKFHAPFDGYVVLANDPSRNAGGPQIEAGATVRQRQKMFSLLDLSAPLRVNAKVHESQVDRITPGQRATIVVDAFADQKMTGDVKSVARLPDPTFRFGGPKVYSTLVEIDNGTPDLRPGMTARVDILIAERDNVLNVPVKAILSFDGKYHVAVKKPDGGFEWRGVGVGLADDKVVEIKQGLRSGDVVALDPLALMSEEEKRQKFGSPPRPTEPAARKNAPE
jgi:RND family efflux transporter MFP subunit